MIKAKDNKSKKKQIPRAKGALGMTIFPSFWVEVVAELRRNSKGKVAAFRQDCAKAGREKPQGCADSALRYICISLRLS
jgi:hypothetical protein